MKHLKLTTILFALLCLVTITLVNCKKDEPEEAAVEETGIKPGSKDDDPLTYGTEITTMSDAKIDNLDNKTEKCWHVATQITYAKQSFTEDVYLWATEQDLVSFLKSSYDEIMTRYQLLAMTVKVQIAYQEVIAKDENTCEDLNKFQPTDPHADDKATCYMITVTMDNTSESFYAWTTEDLLKQLLANYQFPGVTVKWKTVPASDREACNAKNNDY